MPYEQTFVMLKPGVLQRRIAGEVVSRLERKGLKIIALKMMRIPRSLCERHYEEHRGEYFYSALVDYMTSGPVLALIVAGTDAIAVLRLLTGPKDHTEAPPGTIRGDFCAFTRKNIVHASDSAESAKREIELFFTPGEIFEWEDGNERWFF